MAARTMAQAGLTIHSTGWTEMQVTRASRATLRVAFRKVLAYMTTTYPLTPYTGRSRYKSTMLRAESAMEYRRTLICWSRPLSMASATLSR